MPGTSSSEDPAVNQGFGDRSQGVTTDTAVSHWCGRVCHGEGRMLWGTAGFLPRLEGVSDI